MIPETNAIQAPASFEEADLLRLEIKIARRADRLWRSSGCCAGRDMIHWLQAESEVLGKYFGLEWPLALAADTEA